MKIFSKIIYGLFILFLIVVAGVFLASLVPLPGNIEVKIVKSGSMEPTIKTGSIVIVKPSASYALGDIITFGEDSKRQIPTTNRIVNVVNEGGKIVYMTKGDANEEADPQQVPAEKVIGKIVFAAPYVGYVLDFAKKPIGFILLIGVPAGVIIIDESARIIGEVVMLRRKKQRDALES